MTRKLLVTSVGSGIGHAILAALRYSEAPLYVVDVNSAAFNAGFETEWLATADNLAALTELSGVWIDRVHERNPPPTIILYRASSESPICGEREGATYSGHFGCTPYHALFLLIGTYNPLSAREPRIFCCGNVLPPEQQSLRALMEQRPFKLDRQ